jgi:hypothetical protein
VAFELVDLVDDPSPAAWLGRHLLPWPEAGLPVGAIIPSGFEGYARILHPARDSRGVDPTKTRWRDIAKRENKHFHPEVQWGRLVGADDLYSLPYDVPRPEEGSLDRDETEVLATILSEFTDTLQRCWFCVWNGFGWLELALGHSRFDQFDPRLVHLPYREYLLFRGPIEAVTSFGWRQNGHHFFASPNIWWPDDRSWCVASEIDLVCTFVGGSAACIERVLASAEIETIRTRIDARADAGADRLNLTDAPSD